MIRLDKFLAEAGQGRRKEIRMQIKNGAAMVNGDIVTQPCTWIEEEDQVYYHHQKVSYVKKVYFMFHKPSGCITARKDSTHATVMDYIKDKDSMGLFPVGRLDKDTEGILLFTNDGTFEHTLMHPDQHVEKTYFFWACGEMTASDQEQLRSGVILCGEQEKAIAKDIRVIETANLTEVAYKIEKECLEGRNFPNGQKVTCGEITIMEGRKHQVKRMLRAVGLRIIYLKRTAIGNVVLDESLRKGEYRNLTKEELELLQYPS